MILDELRSIEANKFISAPTVAGMGSYLGAA